MSECSCLVPRPPSPTSPVGRAGECQGSSSTEGLFDEPFECDDPSTAPLPAHLLPESADISASGRLSIADVDVLDLVEEVGTPVFIYDELHLRLRCREALCAFGPGVAYASKAFLCRAMAQLVVEEEMSLDVSTGGELYTALSAGVPPERIVLHGNNKSDDELAMAIRFGVGRVVVDSFDEIERLQNLTEHSTKANSIRVLLRVTPGVQPDTHSYVTTGQADSKFGFGLASGAAASAARHLRRLGGGIELVGLHMHVASQMMELGCLKSAITTIADLFVSLDLEELCVGGGLGVSYSGLSQAPSISEWGRAVHRACDDAGIPKSVRITAEPGRSVAAAAAITCYKVGTIKKIADTRPYVSVNGGMSDNIRPALYGSRYEAFLPRVAASGRPLSVTVVGKHCESGDVVVKEGFLPSDTSVGDVLAIPVTGAYGYAMSSNYNKVPRPPIVFVRDGRFRVVVRRETYDDLIRLDS